MLLARPDVWVHVTEFDPALCRRNCLLPHLRRIPGVKQPLIVKWLDSITDTWHVVVPVVDDVTDILLLTSTADSGSALWWVCFMALVVADIERLWLIFTLCLTMVLLPFLWFYDVMSNNFWGKTAARLFARVNCRDSAPQVLFEAV